jgi:tRNA pseudouridine13 synthase
MSHVFEPLPYLTADLPGIGGNLKDQPEDFVVEEIPAYEPCGDGQHLFLWIEKRDLPHEVLLRKLAKILEVSSDDIGTAGIKDRRAITRQYISVPVTCTSRVELLNSDELRVLKRVPHGNKLRTGHLRGNRFTVVVRGVCDDAGDRAAPIAAVINSLGFPNYYGEQRFGHEGETLTLGLDLLAGRKAPRDIPFSKRKFLLRLALSAVQSDLFNQTLALRLRDGLLHTVLEGDVLEVIESGGKFTGEDPVAEQVRLAQGEVSVTGPMFGVKMLATGGVAAEREARVLENSGLKLADFQNYANLLSGARRAFVIRPGELKTTAVELGIQFEFSLPSGVYATMLLREFMKDESRESAGREDGNSSVS